MACGVEVWALSGPLKRIKVTLWECAHSVLTDNASESKGAVLTLPGLDGILTKMILRLINQAHQTCNACLSWNPVKARVISATLGWISFIWIVKEKNQQQQKQSWKFPWGGGVSGVWNLETKGVPPEPYCPNSPGQILKHRLSTTGE